MGSGSFAIAQPAERRIGKGLKMNSSLELFGQDTINILGRTLFHFCWQACLIGLSVAAILALMKRYSARVRYFVVSCGLLLMAISLVATFVFIANSNQTQDLAQRQAENTEPTVVQDDPGDRLRDLAEDMRSEFGLPGIIIGFRQGKHPQHILVAGVTKKMDGRPLKANDRMHLGSVSKPLTATVVADLVAEGLLKWDTKLFDVFPDVQKKAHAVFHDVTVWDLLTHQARFTPFAEDSEIEKAPAYSGNATEDRRQFLRWAVQQPPQENSEDDLPYSNAGYCVLSSIVEQVTGKTYEEVVRKRLFDRLGLLHAGFGWPAKQDPAAPWGHRFVQDAFEPHPPDDDYQLGPFFAAPGDMHMSVGDLLRFGSAHLNAFKDAETPYDRSAIRKLHTTTTAYAGGWYIRPSGHYHTGSAETFFAFILVSPARDTVIAVATNGSNPDSEFKLAGKIIGRVYRAYSVMKQRDKGIPINQKESETDKK